jgi:hypothetical protein
MQKCPVREHLGVDKGIDLWLCKVLFSWESKMTKKRFEVSVTKIVLVEFETDNFDEEFWEDFNTSISDRGGEDFTYLAEHAAWNFVQGEETFIEGIGDLKEMGVKLAEIDNEIDVYAR